MSFFPPFRSLLLFPLLLLLLASCAEMHQGPMDARFAQGVRHNNLSEVRRNATPRNASMPIGNERPMYWAAAHGNEDMIDVLYNNGASLRHRSSSGRSLAYVAAEHGHTTTARKLVSLGAGTSGDISRGRTVYAGAQARQRQQQVANLQALDAFLGAMFRPSGGGGSEGSTCIQCGAPTSPGDGNACSRCRAIAHGAR